MPSRNQYLAELTTPAVRDAEERRLLSPAACAWVGVEKAGQRPWVSLRFAASPRWAVAGGKQHIRAGTRVRVLVFVLVSVQSQVQVRAEVPVC
jgi:hypothetical protein